MNTVEKLVVNFVLFSVLLSVVVVGGIKVSQTPFLGNGFLAVLKILPPATVSVAATTGEPDPVGEPAIEEVVIEPETLLPKGNFVRPLVEAKNKLLVSGLPFAEINFPEMTIGYYEGNELVSTTSVKTAGDPQGWGGTPAGLYSVLSKNERAFSASAEAYMPQALHFYGKYFIHGEPYYASGKKINSPVSGGCVQVADEYAPRLFEILSPNLPILVIDKNYDDFLYPAGRSLAVPKVTAEGILVADLDSGEVVFEKNSTEKFSIASVTKLMTAVVVAENVDLRRNITVNDEMIELGFGTTNNLLADASFRVVELFYPLLIESSNDAAEAVSGFLGRERTITLMNEKTKNLFMEDTSFEDPSGIGTENISTARDLYLLGRYIKNNRRPILDITRGKAVTSFGPVRFSVSQMENKNEFAKDRDFIGGKSGYLDEAKNTGLFLFKIKVAGTEREVAIVVLKSEHLKKDVEALKNWVEQNYR